MSKKILLVEDNPQLLRLIGDYLTIREYAVRSVGTAAEALAVLAGDAFDLVIADGVLPGDMSGLALIQEVRRRDPGQALIAMSGHPDLIPTLAATGVAVLQKPFNMKALDLAVRKALAGQ